MFHVSHTDCLPNPTDKRLKGFIIKTTKPEVNKNRGSIYAITSRTSYRTTTLNMIGKRLSEMANNILGVIKTANAATFGLFTNKSIQAMPKDKAASLNRDIGSINRTFRPDGEIVIHPVRGGSAFSQVLASEIAAQQEAQATREKILEKLKAKNSQYKQMTLAEFNQRIWRKAANHRENPPVLSAEGVRLEFVKGEDGNGKLKSITKDGEKTTRKELEEARDD